MSGLNLSENFPVVQRSRDRISPRKTFLSSFYHVIGKNQLTEQAKQVLNKQELEKQLQYQLQQQQIFYLNAIYAQQLQASGWNFSPLYNFSYLTLQRLFSPPAQPCLFPPCVFHPALPPLTLALPQFHPGLTLAPPLSYPYLTPFPSFLPLSHPCFIPFFSP